MFRMEIEPAVDVKPGVYPFEFLERVQPKTAGNTETYLNGIYNLPAEGTEYRYHRIPIRRLVGENPFCYTLAKYATESPERIAEMIREGKVPYMDLTKLNEPYKGTVKAYLQGEATEEQLEGATDYVSYEVAEDVERVHDALEGIKERGYYPPTVTAKLSILDGYHRVVALHYLLEPREEIFVWQMTQTLDELKELS